MFTSRALSLVLLVIIHAPHIRARSLGHDNSTPVFLNLGAVDAATFSFYVIFTVLTFIQLLQARPLSKRKDEEDFARRVPFILIMLLGICSQTATYALSALLLSQTTEVTLPTLNLVVVTTMLSFVRTLTHLLLYAALLLLLDYRIGIQALEYQHSRSKNLVIALRAASAVPLLLMFVCIIARVIIGTTQSMTYLPGHRTPEAAQAYDGLYHFFLACYVVLTAIICGTSVVLWLNKLDSQHDWVLFDTNVLTRIVKIICPLLAIRAIFELIVDIISSTPQFYLAIDNSAFTLAVILIRGLTYFVVISVLLQLGLLPKPKRGWWAK